MANDAARRFNEHEPLGKTIAGHVYESLVEAFRTSLEETLIGSESQTLDESEAASIISHVEHFHILFDEGRYEQAAWHAVKSPKSVLRSYETFKKFKEAQQSSPELPVMYHFAKSYMSTKGSDLGSRGLSEEMSVEFVRAMVRAGEQKLVYQWFQNGWLNASKQVADLLACDRHSKIHGTVVAENIYMRLGMYHDAIRCMAFRGDIPAAVSFAQDTANFEKDDYIDLLLSVPSVKLARALSAQKYPGTDQVLLPCGQIALLLLKDINIEIAGEFLKTLDLRPPVTESGSGGTQLAPNCIFSDEETSTQDWYHVVKQLEHTVYEDLGVEIVAALSINTALNVAIKDTQLQNIQASN